MLIDSDNMWKVKLHLADNILKFIDSKEYGTYFLPSSILEQVNEVKRLKSTISKSSKESHNIFPYNEGDRILREYGSSYFVNWLGRM